jgi:uncharacterized protein YdhG (YjbR/CyaY superfamily)
MEQVRATISQGCSGATESISYQMPAFNLHGYLVYFGAWQNHIRLYPMPSGMKEFEKELSKYASGKGSVQFPNDEPLPLSFDYKNCQVSIEGKLREGTRYTGTRHKEGRRKKTQEASKEPRLL